MRFTIAGLSKVRSTLIFGQRRRRCPDFGKDAAQGGAMAENPFTMVGSGLMHALSMIGLLLKDRIHPA